MRQLWFTFSSSEPQKEKTNELPKFSLERIKQKLTTDFLFSAPAVSINYGNEIEQHDFRLQLPYAMQSTVMLINFKRVNKQSQF